MESHCIPYTRVPKTSPLYLDYLYHFDRVAPFYPGSPFTPSSFHTAARALDYPARLRSEVVRILTRQNAAWGAGEPAHSSLRRLAEPGTLAVVTGQQVGFFSGPAFTLYKALTAVRLAQWLSEQGLPSVPIFWLATEDHDLAEVASTAILDDDYNRVPLADAGVRPAPQSSVGQVRLSDAVTEALERLESALPAGEARQRLLGDLRSAYQPGSGWGEAYARFLTRVFARWGVVLLDALDPELHRLAAPAYAQAVAAAPELAARLLERSRVLVDSGYHAQVYVNQDSSLLFAARDGNRLPLRSAKTTSGFKLGNGARLSADEVQHWIGTRPEDFTPNALFRPVVQDQLLPTLAYIAGPAELAYHAQSAALYPSFRRPQPVIFPRASFTLVDPRSERLLKKYGLSVEDAWQGEAHLRRRIASAGFAEGWEDRLSAAEQELTELLARLRSDVQALDPTLVDALERAGRKSVYQFERLKGKITRAAFARSQILQRHEQALARFLTPAGDLQERGLGGVYFLGRAGYDLLDQLLARISTGSADHQVVFTQQAVGSRQ